MLSEGENLDFTNYSVTREEKWFDGKFLQQKGMEKTLKITQHCWLTVTKPLDQNSIIRYQWKNTNNSGK